MSLTTIKLYGPLRKLFGREYKFEVGSTAEAIRALCLMVDGFESYLRTAEDRGVGFAVFNGKRNIGKDELGLTAKKEIRIAPVYGGRKSNNGVVQILVGIVLIAAAFFTGGAALAAGGIVYAGLAGQIAVTLGASLLLGGIVQMLSPTAQTSGANISSDPENKPSYAFGGPVNTSAQGYPIAVFYGEREVGGAVISAGIYSEDKA
jgi:predicted phage tail protein